MQVNNVTSVLGEGRLMFIRFRSYRNWPKVFGWDVWISLCLICAVLWPSFPAEKTVDTFDNLLIIILTKFPEKLYNNFQLLGISLSSVRQFFAAEWISSLVVVHKINIPITFHQNVSAVYEEVSFCVTTDHELQTWTNTARINLCSDDL